MGTVRRAFRCIPSALPTNERAAAGTAAQGSAGRMGIHLVSGAALWRVPRSGATGLRASSSARELGSRDDSPAWDGPCVLPLGRPASSLARSPAMGSSSATRPTQSPSSSARSCSRRAVRCKAGLPGPSDTLPVAAARRGGPPSSSPLARFSSTSRPIRQCTPP
jgi:hypothetical protein